MIQRRFVFSILLSTNDSRISRLSKTIKYILKQRIKPAEAMAHPFFAIFQKDKEKEKVCFIFFFEIVCVYNYWIRIDKKKITTGTIVAT